LPPKEQWQGDHAYFSAIAGLSFGSIRLAPLQAILLLELAAGSREGYAFKSILSIPVVGRASA
jgi:hypothetical protein